MKNKTTVSALRELLKKPLAMWAGVIGLLGVYVALTLRTITQSSIWFDEGFSAYIVRFNYWDIARYTAADVHPPLYYWALKTWQYAFGSSEAGLRSMSVAFAVVAIVVGFLLVKKWFGRKAAFISLLLLVLSPMLVRYGQEARMYTMAAAIAVGATYVLTLAMEQKGRRLWGLYAALVAAGMLTHYFTAFVWIAHWAWRAYMTHRSGLGIKAWAKKMCEGRWLWAYLVAIACFVPWLPFMAIQLVSIQVSGFWIGPVGVDTFANYLSNYVFYREHGEALGWYAVVIFLLVGLGSWFASRTYRQLDTRRRAVFCLLLAVAIVPVVGLFVVSLPPAKSSFVERYLLPSYVALSLVLGVALAGARIRRAWQTGIVAVMALSMVVGVSHVYEIGNYNKNTNTDIQTRQLVQRAMANASPGEPVVTSTPWLFFEAAFYATPEHPVYFLEKSADWKYGSLKMLRENPDHKITDEKAFAKQYQKAWYIGSTDVPYGTWQKLQEFSFTSSIHPADSYYGAEFRLR